MHDYNGGMLQIVSRGFVWLAYIYTTVQITRGHTHKHIQISIITCASFEQSNVN